MLEEKIKGLREAMVTGAFLVGLLGGGYAIMESYGCAAGQSYSSGSSSGSDSSSGSRDYGRDRGDKSEKSGSGGHRECFKK